MPSAVSVEPLRMNPSVEVDGLDAVRWSEACDRFADANIYQSWPYEAVRSGAENVSHLVLRDDAHVASVVQVRIARVPYLRSGVAYVRWGPLWKPRNNTISEDVF